MISIQQKVTPPLPHKLISLQSCKTLCGFHSNSDKTEQALGVLDCFIYCILYSLHFLVSACVHICIIHTHFSSQSFCIHWNDIAIHFKLYHPPPPWYLSVHTCCIVNQTLKLRLPLIKRNIMEQRRNWSQSKYCQLLSHWQHGCMGFSPDVIPCGRLLQAPTD